MTNNGGFSRMRAVAFAVLVLTFIAGALGGMAVDRKLNAAERRPAREGHRGSPFAPGSRLSQKLKLTDQQRTQIEAIVAREKPHADSIFRAMGDQMRIHFDSMDAHIRTVLTPEQQKSFDAFVRERREMMRKRGGPRRM